MKIENKIEALLFWKAEPMTVKKIADVLKVSIVEVQSAIKNLHDEIKGRGITLVEWEDEVTLGTARGASELIETLTKEELSKDLGKAGLETLSIVLYEGPLSRAQIDHIRGVNSQFILRNLLVRGLIDRVGNPEDMRGFMYKPSLELLSYLGVSKISDLPDFENVRRDIENFKQNKDDKQNTDDKQGS